MSLRITQGAMYRNALADIRAGLGNYLRLQHQVSTGRRVNVPSDDPVGALRILPLQGDLRDLGQLRENVALARETLNLGAATLEDASSLFARVRELTVQAANSTVNGSDRRSIGGEIGQLLDQLTSFANLKRGDRYLFGGTESGRAPFDLVTDGGGTRAVYRGTRDSLSVEVAPGVTTALNLPGDGIFLRRDRTATTFTPLPGTPATGARATSAGDTGVGFGSFQATFAGLHTDAPSTVTAGSGASTALGKLAFAFTAVPATLSIGGGPAVAIPVTNGSFTTADGRTLSLTVSGVAAPASGTFTAKAALSADGGASSVVTDFTSSSLTVRDSFADTVLHVDVANLARTGEETVEYGGTFDAFTTLIALRDLLTNDAALPDEVVRDRVSRLLAAVDGAHEAVLDAVREQGFRGASMDVLENRVEGLQAASAESLSRVQDTDIAEAIMALQRQELSYQAALQVAGRILQTSLQDFLR